MVNNDIVDGLKSGAVIALGGSMLGFSPAIGYPAVGWATERFLDFDMGTEVGVALGAGALLSNGFGTSNTGGAARQRM